MAFTEGIPLCETFYVSVCFACGDKSFAAVSVYMDNLLPNNIPKNALNSMHVTLVSAYKHVILLLHF